MFQTSVNLDELQQNLVSYRKAIFKAKKNERLWEEHGRCTRPHLTSLMDIINDINDNMQFLHCELNSVLQTSSEQGRHYETTLNRNDSNECPGLAESDVCLKVLSESMKKHLVPVLKVIHTLT